jgi:ribosomal-protein-alanine N-acetyltransferase
MTSKIEIIQTKNAELLARLHAACFEKAWDSIYMASLLARPGTISLCEKEYKGFGIIRLAGDDVEILTIATLPGYRKQGIGEALISAMIEAVRVQKASAIFLEVSQSNSSAINLYNRVGFTVISKRKDYYRKSDNSYENAIIMRCQL